MESFDQMTQRCVVKNEVSDNNLTNTVEHSDSESLLRSSVDFCELPSGKRSSESEQDSQANDGAGSPLPPRKRAKTQEEKEQRRMERIMRNRQAAHASREKKRKHLEALELRCSELEREKTRLTGLLTNYDQMCGRVQQLEAVIKTAQSSGDVSTLDSAFAMVPQTSTTVDPQPLSGTVMGMVAGDAVSPSINPPVSVVDNNGGSDSITSNIGVSCSPAPSLEDDCASPEALLKIKTEEELFHPYSPETVHSADYIDDPFGMMGFSFEPDLSTTLDANGHPENSSKSRHPAAMTPLFDYYS